MSHRTVTGTDKVIIHGGGHVKWRSHVDGDAGRSRAAIGVSDSDSVCSIGCRRGHRLPYSRVTQVCNRQPAEAVGSLAAVDVDMKLSL